MEEVLKAKEYENTARSVVLPVSTRAIGVSVDNKATSTETNRQRLPAVTIHQLYRVFLAMVERKVFENRLDARLDDRDIWYDPAPFEPFETVITSNNIRPQQIGALIRCLPNFKYDETNFVMLFPAKQFTAQQVYIPIPEVVYLTNLRDTVVSLSNPQTVIAVRRNFINRNAIPGAEFNAQGFLTNADAIIPANYDAAALLEDVYAVKNWIEAASDLKSSRENWFTRIQLSESNHGNESMLVSSEPENLRIQTVIGALEARTYRIQGDITDFWFRSKMSDQMVFYGTYHLGGEQASLARYLYPAYCLRTKGANGIDTKRSFREVVLAVED